MINKTLLHSGARFKRQFPWYFLVILQGSGIVAVFAPTGLDLGYNWSVTKATEQSLFGQGLFVGPYGPLGFLEFAYPNWSAGFVMSLLWQVSLSSLLFASLTRLLSAKVTQFHAASFASLLIVTIVNSINITSTIVILLYCIKAITLTPVFSKSKSKEIVADSLLLTTVFFIKPLPFVLILILIGVYYLNNTGFIRNFFAITLLSFVAFLIILYLSDFSVDSFQFWLRGYIEVSKGYSEMSSEDPNRLIEYPLVVLLSTYVMYKVYKTRSKTTLLGFGLVLYYSFRYGFNRHDAHSIFTFTILFVVILSLSLWVKVKNLRWLLFSLLALIIASSYSIVEIVNIKSRASNTLIAARTIYDSQFLKAQINQQKQSVFAGYGIESAIVKEIDGKSVAVLPLQEDLSVIGAKNQFPPMSSLFSAYTPWLDSANADWLRKDVSPVYLLLQTPSSIDGRFPWWDSPRFWVEALCRYETKIASENWLLLVQRESPVCQFNAGKLVSRSEGTYLERKVGNTSAIYIARINQKQDIAEKILRILFKPISQDSININGVKFRLVWNNQEYLPLYIPDLINLPGVWRIPDIRRIETEHIANFELLKIELPQ
jgi:hypothetical protein